MHRTLKAEATRPSQKTIGAQNRTFDRFRAKYNEERPHEALGMKTPASCYQPSPRLPPRRLPTFSYPAEFRTRKVHYAGRIRWPGRHLITVGAPLQGEIVGCQQVADWLWEVYLGPLRLGFIDMSALELGLIRVDA